MSQAGDRFEQLELKYCERCGGLWLRRQGSEEVFCAPCAPKMAEFPANGARTGGQPRLPVARPGFEVETSVIDLWAIAEVEL